MGTPEPIAEGLCPPNRRSSYGSWISERASDSSSSKVDANRDSRIADEKSEGGILGLLENEALRVGTEDGRPGCKEGEFGLRPEDIRGQTPGPPEVVRIVCREGDARKAWLLEVRGGWLAARSRRLRLVGVSEPWEARKRLVRSVSSDVCFAWGDCMIPEAGKRSYE